eukprot:11156898-Lingulodinium_polyedra.AAC.1
MQQMQSMEPNQCNQCNKCNQSKPTAVYCCGTRAPQQYCAVEVPLHTGVNCCGARPANAPQLHTA